MTLGNSLRRVLLSSLQGAAVTSVQIDGVVHEFSSMEGVREDVVDIILNIKQLALRMHAEGPKRMTLRATGPGPVTAEQIDAPADIEILNKDHVICTLDDGATVRMEFTVNTGKGYVAAEHNRPEDAPIGLIAVDSLYSPVKRVAYRVEPTRQGQSLDYDRLIIEVRDTGIGITQEGLDTLFKAFSQAEGDTAKRFGGTGLGLALTKRFCNLMGGNISVTSQRGEGSSFIIDIPCREVRIEDTKSAA